MSGIGSFLYRRYGVKKEWDIKTYLLLKKFEIHEEVCGRVVFFNNMSTILFNTEDGNKRCVIKIYEKNMVDIQFTPTLTFFTYLYKNAVQNYDGVTE